MSEGEQGDRDAREGQHRRRLDQNQLVRDRQQGETGRPRGEGRTAPTLERPALRRDRRGHLLHGKEELFATSYLENALTSNPALSPLSARDPEDVYRLIGMPRGDGTTPDQLAQSY